MDTLPLTDVERADRRKHLIARFALLGPSGAAQRHHAEVAGSPDAGSAHKVILPSQAYARRLAGALLAIGEQPQEEYVCRAGHWHLRNQAKADAYRARRYRGAPLAS